MKSTRFLSVVGAVLLGGHVFAACGGLRDQEIVIDDSRTGSGGSGSGGASSGSGGTHSDGGDDGIGGLPDGGETSVDGPPTVVSVTPEDGEEDVILTSSVEIVFSEGLDESTVNAESIRVMDGDTALDGDLDYGSSHVIFDPAGELSLLARYDVSVNTSVTDTTGNALASPFASSFVTRDGQWETEMPVADAADMRVAVDGQGNLLVAYIASGTPSAFWVSEDGTVGDPTPLDTSTTATDIDVAAAPNGNAVVVYRSGALGELWGRRFTDGEWEPGSNRIDNTIDANNEPVTGPVVEYQGERILVAWTRATTTGTVGYIDSAIAGPTGTWTFVPNVVIASSASNNYLGDVIDLSMASTGNAMLVYGQANSVDNYFPYYARFIADGTSGGTWQAGAPVLESGTQEIFETDYEYYGPAVALAEDDSAVVVWNANMGGEIDIYAAHYTKAGGWEDPVPLEVATGNSFISQESVAAHASGFTVVWKQEQGDAFFNGYRATFTASTGEFAEAELVSSGDDSLEWGVPHIGGDPHGNALVVWAEGGQNYALPPYVAYSRYNALSDTWSASDEFSVNATDQQGYQIGQLRVGTNGAAGVMLWGILPGGSFGGPFYTRFH